MANVENLVGSRSVMTKPTLIIPNDFITYGVNLVRRMLDKILYTADKREIP
jgi:hypothetical protein